MAMKHFYRLTQGKHYRVLVDSVTGQDWSPELNKDVFDWLQDNMEYGMDYEYSVGDITTRLSTDIIVGLTFATEENLIAFKLRWI